MHMTALKNNPRFMRKMDYATLFTLFQIFLQKSQNFPTLSRSFYFRSQTFHLFFSIFSPNFHPQKLHQNPIPSGTSNYLLKITLTMQTEQ